MCGIFGLIVYKNNSQAPDFISDSLTDLARLSESRGKDSSGFAFRNNEKKKINVIRASIPITALMKREVFKKELANCLPSQTNGSMDKGFAAIGHSRLVTNGSQLNDQNNQPVIKDGLVGVHNGIIVNEDQLWQTSSISPKKYEIDTEVMFSLFRHYENTLKDSNLSIAKTCKEINGTVATGFFIDNKNEMVLATNNGSLYILSDLKSVLMFASERFILETVMNRRGLNKSNNDFKIFQVKSNTGYLLDLNEFRLTDFNFHEEKKEVSGLKIDSGFEISSQSVEGENNSKSLLVDFESILTDSDSENKRKLLEYNFVEVSKLKRCSKCVLPETFPFITFDEKGICNYCINYKMKNQPRPLDDLLQLVEPYKSKDGSHDCIVPFSGGRDSTFLLHMVKKELGLNPIAFTYDWGMVTDLARRNIARVCGKLGVENIIVAADIVTKRRNIKNNILAWLKRPSLGMIPLFMSGDKYFFYYTNQLKKQTGIQLNLWGINNLENTNFKTGFAGVRPIFNKKRIYSLGLSGQFSFFSYVGRNFLMNPAYFNSSNLDSIGSILSRYLFPQKDYYSIFDYYQWNEKEIEDLILGEYDWERAIDTKSTWRIGDGTASFYNYVYYNVAGFSENETFRSNQIREGMLSREEALTFIQEENQPRYENIRWYLDIVGIDFESTIKRINSIPKFYRK